jgi:hypothetical protein
VRSGAVVHWFQAVWGYRGNVGRYAGEGGPKGASHGQQVPPGQFLPLVFIQRHVLHHSEDTTLPAIVLVYQAGIQAAFFKRFDCAIDDFSFAVPKVEGMSDIFSVGDCNNVAETKMFLTSSSNKGMEMMKAKGQVSFKSLDQLSQDHPIEPSPLAPGPPEPHAQTLTSQIPPSMTSDICNPKLFKPSNLCPKLAPNHQIQTPVPVLLLRLQVDFALANIKAMSMGKPLQEYGIGKNSLKMMITVGNAGVVCGLLPGAAQKNPKSFVPFYPKVGSKRVFSSQTVQSLPRAATC